MRMVRSRSYYSIILLLLLATSAEAQRVELLDFYLPTCAPCRAMGPTIDRLASEGLPVRKIDGSRDVALAQRFRVNSYPTFIIMVDGVESGRVVGMTSHESLRTLLTQAGANRATTNPVADSRTFVPTTGSRNFTVGPDAGPGQQSFGQRSQTSAPSSLAPRDAQLADDQDEASALSDLTGNAYDQEIVEELHHALTDLRQQLEESRAEAARAVKVAEQAIQSAERSESADWQNTVTHKAAEAAALAQKRSAAALAQQRLAEERLGNEKRAASFWRAQAELAEEEAGALHTKAAAAQVQRSAMEEQLMYERRLASEQISILKARISNEKQNQALEEALERNRALEIELDATRRDLESRPIESPTDEAVSPRTRKNFLFGRRKKAESDNESLLANDIDPSCSDETNDPLLPNEQVIKVHTETQLMKEQFELLRRCTSDQLQQLPISAELWGEQVSHALKTSQAEVRRLQERLAIESAARRKLLHEVQDLRGTIRVYCRPKPGQSNGCLVVPSQDTILVKEEAEDEFGTSFEFDGVFTPETLQKEVYNEIEEVCLSVLDGYRICLMALGPQGCGKTCTLLGETIGDSFTITNHGVQFLTCQQLFKVAEERTDRFKDKFLLTVTEVYNERLCDVLAMTPTGELKGEEVSVRLKPNKRKSKSQEDDSAKQSRLEIRTDIHGDTVVQGLVSVEVTCYEDITRVWTECLQARARKAAELGIEASTFASSSHMIATLKVNSTNITTGITSVGQIQFADLAAAEVVSAEVSETSGPTRDWRFSNRSLEALCSVVESRIRFDRSVPFRTSTLTHLLRDSFEADTKVIVIACISEDRLLESAATLKFASRMRRVNIGKATRHTVSPP